MPFNNGEKYSIFTGRRSPSTIEQIRQVIEKGELGLKLLLSIQNNHYLPSRIMLEANDTEPIQKLADKLGIRYISGDSIAWQLANYSLSINETSQKRMKINKLTGWDKKVFDTNSLRFEVDCSDKNTGLIRWRNPKTSQTVHYYYADHTYEVNCEWGRFLLLNAMEENILFYNKKSQVLYIPVTVPLPRFLSRALTLCSGLLPEVQTVKDLGCYAYKDVSLHIANIISTKLKHKYIDIY